MYSLWVTHLSHNFQTKDNTDKAAYKHARGPGIEKKKKGIETDPNRNTMVLLYEPSALKKKEKGKASKRGKGSKTRNKRKVPEEMVFSFTHQHLLKEYFPMRMSLPAPSRLQSSVREAFKSICSPLGSSKEEGAATKVGDAMPESQSYGRHSFFTIPRPSLCEDHEQPDHSQWPAHGERLLEDSLLFSWMFHHKEGGCQEENQFRGVN